MDERFRIIVEQHADLAGEGVDIKDAEAAVAAVGLVIEEMLIVAAPANGRVAVEIDFLSVDFDAFLVGHVERPQFIGRVGIARQWIGPLAELRRPPSGGDVTMR